MDVSNKVDATSSEYVQTLAKGLEVIKCFGHSTPTRTVSDVAEAVGLSRAAARRFLMTLEALGYTERSGRTFRLTPQILDLGYSYIASQPWRDYAQRVIDRLGSQIECACAVAVLDRDSAAYVAFSPGGTTSNVIRNVGTRLPAFATAVGRVLLAHASQQRVEDCLDPTSLQKFTPFTEIDRSALKADLEGVRSDGFSFVAQQLEIGLYSLGVPIVSRSGAVVAGLSASARSYRVSREDFKARNLDALLAAASEISSGIAV